MNELQSYKSSCPKCGNDVNLSESEIFQGKPNTERAIEYYEAKLREITHKKETLLGFKTTSYDWLEVRTKAINIGFILERLILTMDQFKYNHNDCRPMFDPIDYIVFHGLSESGIVDSISFIDIKTGNAKLTKGQQEIAQTITDGNVKFRTY